MSHSGRRRPASENCRASRTPSQSHVEILNESHRRPIRQELRIRSDGTGHAVQTRRDREDRADRKTCLRDPPSVENGVPE